MARVGYPESKGLSHYIGQITRRPVLSREEEASLVARMKEDADEFVRRELVSAHLPLVLRVAKPYRNMGLSLDDLVAEGNVGLMRAARRFNGDRGVRFMTCAIWWIRKSILDALNRDASLVRIPDSRLRAMRRARAAATSRISGNPGRWSDPSPARPVPLTTAELEQLLAIRWRAVRLDPGGPGFEERRRILDWLADDRAPRPDTFLLRQEARARVQGALARLSDRERSVLEERFGLNDEDPQSLKQTGRKLGVSHARVQQIEMQARRKLRRLLEPRRESA